MDRTYITPKRIVTQYAGCKNDLTKDEHYLLERENGQSSVSQLRMWQPHTTFSRHTVR